MKIVSRTSLVFTLFSAAILFLFAYSIYFFSEKNRQEEFVDRLRYKITWRAEFFFDAQVDESQIRQIHEQNKRLINEAQITVFTHDFRVLFADYGEQHYSRSVLDSMCKQNFTTWQSGGELYMALHYPFRDQQYYLIGHAYDQTGYAHMERLKQILISIYIVAVIFIFFASFFFAQYILKPIKHIINEIRDVSEHNLSKRVYYRKAKDELSELIDTFNGTFNRLEQSFNNQRHFVSIISHEFRTPLAAMIAELELAKELNTTVDEYRHSVDTALSDAREATVLSTALLDFARSNYDSSQVSFTKLRLDEVLIDAKLMVLDKDKDYRVSVSFDNQLLEEEEGQDEIELLGNAYLLKVAFANVMENACKYSADKHCLVHIRFNQGLATVDISDKGIGIPELDMPHIFELFYRADSTASQSGHGIGLAIVQRIVDMHKGQLFVESVINNGSTFTFQFNKMF